MAMSPQSQRKTLSPYQPFLLRVLHSVSGLLAIGAIFTGFTVYNTYDGRFGRLPLPQLPDIQGIHGTFGLFFLIFLPGLAIYSFRSGQKRLIQLDTLPKLGNSLGQPLWWIQVQRLTNTLMLLAATIAVMSGRMMKEEWLPAGELHHVWYAAHLIGWVILIVSLMLHLLMSAKVGGMPLLVSMWQWGYRSQDNPKLWWGNIQDWLKQPRMKRTQDENTPLKVVEILVIGGILLAFILPTFSYIATAILIMNTCWGFRSPTAT